MAKKSPLSLVISIVMAMFRCDMVLIARYRRSRATLDATGGLPSWSDALYCTGGRHGHQFQLQKLSCGVVKSLSEASSKGTKRTLYSAHQSDKLRIKVEHHDLS